MFLMSSHNNRSRLGRDPQGYGFEGVYGYDKNPSINSYGKPMPQRGTRQHHKVEKPLPSTARLQKRVVKQPVKESARPTMMTRLFKAAGAVTLAGVSYNIAVGKNGDASKVTADKVPVSVNLAQQPKTNGHWSLTSNWEQNLEEVGLSDQREAFIKNIIVDAVDVANEPGVRTNPIVLTAKAALESNYGTDTISGPDVNNFFGIKGPADLSKSVKVPTHEYIKGKKVKVDAYFRKYPTGRAALEGLVEMEGRLEWFDDTEGCIADPVLFVAAEQHKLDPASCKVVGEEPAYATAPNYESAIISKISKLGLEKDIIYTP